MIESNTPAPMTAEQIATIETDLDAPISQDREGVDRLARMTRRLLAEVRRLRAQGRMSESEPMSKEGTSGDRRVTIQVHGCGEPAREVSFDFSGPGGIATVFEGAHVGLVNMVGTELKRRLGLAL